MFSMQFLRRPSSLIAAVTLATTLAAAISAGPAVAAAVPQPHLAAADVNAAWQFPAKNWSASNKQAGRVDDILRIGSRVYIGGNFTISENHSGKTVTRTYLAAENASTGALLNWKPTLNGRVYAIGASKNHKSLYVVGDFTSVDGVARTHVASFNIASGKLGSAIPALGINGQVRAISRAGTSIYIGGDFTQAGGHAHARLARLDLVGGHYRVAAWNPTADNQVRDLIADAAHNRVIVAGWFNTIDGVKGQHDLASISMTTGRPLPWGGHAPDPVLDIARSGHRLYAAMGGPGGKALAYNITTGRRVWFYAADGNIQAVTTINGWPIFGTHGDNVADHKNLNLSEYTKSSRIRRHKIFELSPNGVLQSWAPDLGTTQGVLGVWALKSGHGMLYVGGDFTLVNGAQQNRFAMFHSVHG
jgi:outer membrane protein assembly factor BamB